MSKGLIRKLALVVMIVADIVMLGFWWMAGNYAFFWTFVAITGCVIVGELYNVFFGYGKTLSTEAKHTIERGGIKRAYIYCALIFLGVAIAALIVHLGVV